VIPYSDLSALMSAVPLANDIPSEFVSGPKWYCHPLDVKNGIDAPERIRNRFPRARVWHPLPVYNKPIFVPSSR